MKLFSLIKFFYFSESVSFGGFSLAVSSNFTAMHGVWSSGISACLLRTTHQIVEALTHSMATFLAWKIILITLMLLHGQIMWVFGSVTVCVSLCPCIVIYQHELGLLGCLMSSQELCSVNDVSCIHFEYHKATKSVCLLHEESAFVMFLIWLHVHNLSLKRRHHYGVM